MLLNNMVVAKIKPDEDTNFDILNTIMACLIKEAPFAAPVLALEIRAGEYKGVVFSFKTFHVLPIQMAGGFVPTKYETTIHKIPAHFPKDWVPDEAFDAYTSEVLFKWLSYIHLNDMAPLVAARTSPTVQ